MTQVRLKRIVVLVVAAVALATAAVPSVCAAIPPPSYHATVLGDSPAAYWRFEHPSPITDETGHGIDGTSSGLLHAASLLGRGSQFSLQFGGSANVSFGDVLDFPGASPFTLEAWVRPTTLDGTARRIFSKESGAGDGYLLFVNNNSFGFQRRAGGTVDSLASTGLTPQVDHTYYVVATFDGTTMRLYVDGVLRSSRISALALADNPAQLRVGVYSNGSSNGFIGALDEPAVYSSALTQAQINAHAAAAHGLRDEVLGDSPLAYWRFERPGTFTTAFDETGQHPGTIDSLPGVDPARAMGGLPGNGSTYGAILGQGSVNLGDTFDFAGRAAFSLEGWASKRTTGRMFSKETANNLGTQGYDLYVQNGGAYFQRRLNDTVDQAAASAPGATGGPAVHFVATYDGTNMCVYANGGPGSCAESTLELGDNNAPFRIGAYSGNNGSFIGGGLDELAVYDHALSPAEAAAHFDSTRGGYREVVAADVAGPPNGSAGSWWGFGDPALSATLSGPCGGDPSGFPADGHAGLLPLGSTFSYEFHHTAITCGNTVWNRPQRAHFGLEAWVRPTLLDSTARRIFSKESTDTGGATQGYLLYVTNSAFGFQRRRSGVTDDIKSTGVTPQVGRTYHLVATYDGSAMRLYVDGVLVSSRASTQNLTNNTGAFTIGAYSGGTSNFFDGNIDEAAVYPMELSAAQVAAHYAAAQP
jgi:hypothetical protein